MPKYTYKCKKCENCFDTIHGMLIKLENCDACNTSGTLFRVPSVSYSTLSKDNKNPEAGAVVKEFIEDAKQDLKNEKAEMQRDEY